MQTYFIKLGGSVITNTEKPYTAKMGTIRRALNEIKEAKRNKDFNLIIGHGGGSFPHIPAHKYKVNEGLIYKFSRKGTTITHLVAQKLNEIVVNEGIKLGLDLFPFVPSSFLVWNGERALNSYAEHIKEALERGFIPVVYGDAVIDKKKGVAIASTEAVFEGLSREIKASKFILATDVDGIFDKDPKVNKDAKLIREVSSKNINEVIKGAGGSHKIDVTGGMYTKILLLHEMVKKANSIGIITNGNRKGAIKEALLHNSGYFTVVKP